ncbi:MAG: TauD/TfdA family dioxygenase [Acidimicrobiales bacterium]|nr:TauD/TfdA family dioxygenase [Acidimicrobiales bacterium]
MSTTDIVAEKDPSARLQAVRRVGKLFGDWTGPATHLADERERLLGLEWRHFDARMLSPTIGAEISGVDLCSDLADDVVADLAQALADYKVIFFRDQPLTPAQHIGFAKRFGDLEIHPFIPPNPDHPELVHFEKGADVAGYENSWHNDVTWREVPSKAAVLHAIQIPEIGGDTLFADMCAAYDGLDDDTKELIENLDAEHDFMGSFGTQVPEDQLDAFRKRYPIAVHPVAPRHPVTGRRFLYVNRIFTTRILGPEPAEAARLHEYLSRQADNVEYQARFTWQPHSVAMWDNLAVQHYASSDYWPHVRVMERASIIGTRPTR